MCISKVKHVNLTNLGYISAICGLLTRIEIYSTLLSVLILLANVSKNTQIPNFVAFRSHIIVT